MPYRAHKAYSSIKRKNQQLRHLRDSGFLLLPVPHSESVEMGRGGNPETRPPRSPPEAKHRGRKNRSGTAGARRGSLRRALPRVSTAGVGLSAIVATTCCKIRSPSHPEAIKNIPPHTPPPSESPLTPRPPLASARVGRARPPGRVKEKILLEKQPLSSKG